MMSQYLIYKGKQWKKQLKYKRELQVVYNPVYTACGAATKEIYWKMKHHQNTFGAAREMNHHNREINKERNLKLTLYKKHNCTSPALQQDNIDIINVITQKLCTVSSWVNEYFNLRIFRNGDIAFSKATPWTKYAKSHLMNRVKSHKGFNDLLSHI